VFHPSLLVQYFSHQFLKLIQPRYCLLTRSKGAWFLLFGGAEVHDSPIVWSLSDVAAQKAEAVFYGVDSQSWSISVYCDSSWEPSVGGYMD